MVFKVVQGPAFQYHKKKVVFFSDLTPEAQAFGLVISCDAIRVGLSWFQEIQKDHPPPIPKDSAHDLTCWGLALELLWWWIHTLRHYGLLFWLWLIVVTPHLITGNDAIQETVTFSLVLVQLVRPHLHMVFFLFPCEHLCDPLCVNFVMFKPIFSFIQVPWS